MLTTTVGSYPRPDYMPVKDWLGPRDADEAAEEEEAEGLPEPTRAYDEAVAAYGEERLREILNRATAEVVREQDDLGIDVPTDGEVRREDSVLYVCRHLRGIDVGRLSEGTLRGQRALVPTVVGPVAAAGPLPFLPDDWRVAQAATKRPVKMTLPGPMTIGESVADGYYEGDGRRRGGDVADALNREIRALADAGCRHIQIDESVLARRPGEAVAFGIEHLERCFHRVPKEVSRVVHVPRGWPAVPPDAGGQATPPPESYGGELADALEDAAIDAVALEDAREPGDLGLLERFARTTVILGVIDVARSRVETMEEVRDRLRAALEHIDRHRLMAAPDGGLGPLGREPARRKLRVLVEAARGL
jgi:5-methyltetrahydropteroyltriglutamate--homocysteine methyltransferase